MDKLIDSMQQQQQQTTSATIPSVDEKRKTRHRSSKHKKSPDATRRVAEDEPEEEYRYDNDESIPTPTSDYYDDYNEEEEEEEEYDENSSDRHFEKQEEQEELRRQQRRAYKKEKHEKHKKKSKRREEKTKQLEEEEEKKKQVGVAEKHEEQQSMHTVDKRTFTTLPLEFSYEKDNEDSHPSLSRDDLYTKRMEAVDNTLRVFPLDRLDTRYQKVVDEMQVDKDEYLVLLLKASIKKLLWRQYVDRPSYCWRTVEYIAFDILVKSKYLTSKAVSAFKQGQEIYNIFFTGLKKSERMVFYQHSYILQSILYVAKSLDDLQQDILQLFETYNNRVLHFLKDALTVTFVRCLEDSELTAYSVSDIPIDPVYIRNQLEPILMRRGVYFADIISEQIELVYANIPDTQRQFVCAKLKRSLDSIDHCIYEVNLTNDHVNDPIYNNNNNNTAPEFDQDGHREYTKTPDNSNTVFSLCCFIFVCNFFLLETLKICRIHHLYHILRLIVY
jgi:hypothetical protein